MPRRTDNNRDTNYQRSILAETAAAAAAEAVSQIIKIKPGYRFLNMPLTILTTGRHLF